jgi:hemolysin activation/secretion protein
MLLILSASVFSNQSILASGTVARLTQGLTERVEFNVSSFQVIGDNPLSKGETDSTLSPYLGSQKGIDDIENAADALEKSMSANGFSFYRVSFPPQELSDGVINLLVTRFEIGKVNVKGQKYYSDENIKASMPLLKAGKSPSTKEIAKALRVANQNPSKRIRINLSPGSNQNSIDANIAVKEQNPFSISSWVNNTGTQDSGDYRVGASVSHGNLFGLDHSGSLTFITSPEGINDVQQIAASYRVPIYSVGGSINFVAVNSDVDTGVVADVFDVAGRGEVYGVGYSHVLSSVGLYNHGWSAQVQDKLFDNDVQFLGRQLLEDVRSRPLSLSYQASWGNGKGSEWSGLMSVSSNLGGGQFNNARSYDVTRPGATDDWTKINLGANYQIKTQNWLYTAALKIAISSDRLITGEQFAVGGSNSVRGLDERDLRGDEGYQLNFQAWAPPIFKTLRPVAFIDVGHVSNNDPTVSEFRSEDVMSIGALVNWNPTNEISASASYGYLIDGIDSIEAANTKSQDGDGKLHFNLTYRF